MSQNRGYRRDGRQSYQMNSSAHYGGRSQMNVNPWEGGMVPGGRSGVAGLLPTPPQTSSLLSQLSSTEAQLALASNLLSTILRPQQQPQVPSLLSLDSMGPMGGSGGMGYRNSGYGPGGRYDDPGPNRRKRMDQRRPDPYGKPQQGRRNAPARGGADRKTGGNQGLRSPSVGKKGSGTVSKAGGKSDKKDDDKEPKKDKDQEDDKSSDTEKKPDEEDSKREDGEDGEKKRDWKDEKKTDSDEKEGKSKDKDKDTPTSNNRYSGIPPSLLHCHVCNKHMWDETSFQNHLKGRTHQLMMDKLEESYKIKVELIRHEQKVAEQQREIELERMKRQGKKVNMNIREYCTMCDLHFFGNLIVHRKNDRHQQLKNFLHPRCSPCGKEFPTRVEWDHHRLTPLHLRKTADARGKSRKSGSDDEFGIEELIFSKGEGLSKKEIEVRTREEEEDEIKEAKDSELEGEDGANKDDSIAKESTDGEKDGEGDEETTTVGNLRFRVPKYNPNVAVGLSLLKKMTGQTCRACHRFFIGSEDAKTHCRTLLHYNNFVALVKEKAKAAEAKERREKSESKKREASPHKSESGDADDEGNWKRRKVASADDEDEDADADGPEPNKKEETSSEKDGEDKQADSDEAKTKTEPMDTTEGEPEEENTAENKEENTEEVKEGEGGGGGEEKSDKDEGKDEEKKAVVKKEENKDENVWDDVDRDIGTLLESVDGEGETESLNEEDLLNPKEEESPGKPLRGRNKAIRGGATNKATRGRKKK